MIHWTSRKEWTTNGPGSNGFLGASASCYTSANWNHHSTWNRWIHQTYHVFPGLHLYTKNQTEAGKKCIYFPVFKFPLFHWRVKTINTSWHIMPHMFIYKYYLKNLNIQTYVYQRNLKPSKRKVQWEKTRFSMKTRGFGFPWFHDFHDFHDFLDDMTHDCVMLILGICIFSSNLQFDYQQKPHLGLKNPVWR